MGAGSDNATLKFAQQISAMGKDGLSTGDVEQLRRLVFDCLGVSMVGGTLSWTKSIADWARRFDGSGASPVVGTALRVAPTVAALVNGTAAHGYELDDTHDASMSHPGAVVIPAALAVAAERDSSVEDLLRAIAAGYESMARIGMAANAKKVISGGRHPTALFGGFGSAAAASMLYGLDAAGMIRAWGHVLSLAGGSMQFSDENGETAVKRVHAGYAAQNGVLAAELAVRDVGAPERALDGKYGFLGLFAESPRMEELNVARDGVLQIHKISIKPYSCCRLFHSLIDGLREVSDNFTVPLATIDRIDVRGPGVIFDQHMLRRPTSSMAAQYSLPYVVGATLAYGPYSYESYGDDRLADERILSLADRVEGRADPDIEAHYPEHMGTAVEITSVDGAKRSAKVMDSRGTPANPLSIDELEEKAARLVSGLEPRIDLGLVRDVLWKEARARTLADLFGNGLH